MKIILFGDEWEPTEKDGVRSIKITGDGWGLAVGATADGIRVIPMIGNPAIMLDGFDNPLCQDVRDAREAVLAFIESNFGDADLPTLGGCMDVLAGMTELADSPSVLHPLKPGRGRHESINVSRPMASSTGTSCLWGQSMNQQRDGSEGSSHPA